MTSEQFLQWALKLRKRGATLVRHVTPKSEMQVEFAPPQAKEEPQEHAHAIGFAMPLSEDDE